MAERGDFLVAHYLEKLDMWNLKPPLMVWLQVVSMKFLGYNTLAVRLPSALAGLATMLLMLWFSSQVLRQKAIGFLSGMVLATTAGFVAIHVTRTGEYDALLSLFLLAYALTYFRFLHDDHIPKTKSLCYFGLFLTLAILTKGVAGFFFLPGLLVYTIFQKKLFWLLRQPSVYIVGFAVLAVVGAYYLGRETLNPGYLQAVWENELGGRLSTALEGHQRPMEYYISRMFSWQFRPWIFLLPAALLLGYWQYKHTLTAQMVIFLSLNAFVFLLIISLAQTKLGWYNAPVFPLLAFLIGIGLSGTWQWLRQFPWLTKPYRKPLLGFCLLLLVFANPYAAIIDKVYQPKDQEAYKESMRFEHFMKLLTDTNYKVVSFEYNSHLDFHLSAAKYQGRPIDVVNPYVPEMIQVGDQLVFCEKDKQRVLLRNFSYQILQVWESCALVRITELKSKKSTDD